MLDPGASLGLGLRRPGGGFVRQLLESRQALLERAAHRPLEAGEPLLERRLGATDLIEAALKFLDPLAGPRPGLRRLAHAFLQFREALLEPLARLSRALGRLRGGVVGTPLELFDALVHGLLASLKRLPVPLLGLTHARLERFHPPGELEKVLERVLDRRGDRIGQGFFLGLCRTRSHAPLPGGPWSRAGVFGLLARA